jgi:hypothetical protein
MTDTRIKTFHWYFYTFFIHVRKKCIGIKHKKIIPLEILTSGLAYAMLANCDAISGIYTAFFPVIIYIILGTSRHVSMGNNAIST